MGLSSFRRVIDPIAPFSFSPFWLLFPPSLRHGTEVGKGSFSYFHMSGPRLIPSCFCSSQTDAHDIIYVLSTFAQNVDLNRIPEFDMDRFCKTYPGEASFAWNSIKNRYEQVL